MWNRAITTQPADNIQPPRDARVQQVRGAELPAQSSARKAHLGLQRERHEELRGAPEGMASETCRGDADDRERLAVQRHRLAYDLLIAPEPIGPEGVRQHDDPHRRASTIFLFAKSSAHREANAQDIEVVAGNDFPLDLLGDTVQVQGGRNIRDCSQPLEHASIAKVGVLAVREPGPLERVAAVGARDIHGDNPRRVGDRHGAQQNGIHRADDGGVRADAEREREHHDQRERWRCCQHAERVAYVPCEIREKASNRGGNRHARLDGWTAL